MFYITNPASPSCFLAFFSNPYSLFENFIFYHSTCSLCAFFLINNSNRISTQKQSNCLKRCGPVQNGHCEKVVKSKGAANK